MGNEKTYGSVEAFLKSHPQATLDLTTPMGFIHLTPEQREVLLDGGQVFAHPGVCESGHMVNADDVINHCEVDRIPCQAEHFRTAKSVVACQYYRNFKGRAYDCLKQYFDLFCIVKVGLASCVRFRVVDVPVP